YPLSFAQQRLWFLNQLAPDSPFYNIPRAISLSGPLQKTALERSFNELVRRHETLRTRFAISEGDPVQVIEPAVSVPLPVADLADLAEAEREAEVQRLSREEKRYAFDLEQGPLMRAKLLRLGPEQHVLLLNLHHIIADG